MMKYHKNPISLRDGKVFIDGVECMDGVECSIKFTPEVWTGKQLGEKASSSRWIGYDITGTLTRRRTTNFYKTIIQKYMDRGETLEFTIQGIMNDPSSEYYSRHGTISATAIGCVFTGDIALISLDSGGTVVEDSLAFNAKDVNIK